MTDHIFIEVTESITAPRDGESEGIPVVGWGVAVENPEGKTISVPFTQMEYIELDIETEYLDSDSEEIEEATLSFGYDDVDYELPLEGLSDRDRLVLVENINVE